MSPIGAIGDKLISQVKVDYTPNPAQKKLVVYIHLWKPQDGDDVIL